MRIIYFVKHVNGVNGAFRSNDFAIFMNLLIIPAHTLSAFSMYVMTFVFPVEHEFRVSSFINLVSPKQHSIIYERNAN